MNSILLCSLILAILQLQNAITFGKAIVTAEKMTASQRAESSSTPKVSTAENNSYVKTNDARVRRSFYGNNDEDDFLINQLSRENDIMTLNLLDSAVTCNK